MHILFMENIFQTKLNILWSFLFCFFKLVLKSSLEIDHNCTVKPKEMKQQKTPWSVFSDQH